MASNRGVAYVGTGKVEVRPIDYPKLSLGDRKCEHGVILKVVTTNICGSDQHMVRGRTTAPSGLVLGHEITGEIIETGRDVEFLKVGDLVSVPFNIACGRCRNCKEGKTGICLNVNPARPGAAYGYVDMGGWIGGQAEYVMVPYADFNLLKFPDKRPGDGEDPRPDVTLRYFPTGYHGAVTAGVDDRLCRVRRRAPGRSDSRARKLAASWRGGCDRRRPDSRASRSGQEFRLRNNRSSARRLRSPSGSSRSRCTGGGTAVDCVGFEARGHGQSGVEHPATVLNSLMTVTRAGGAIGIPGLYVTDDPGAVDANAKIGISAFESDWVGRSRTRSPPANVR